MRRIFSPLNILILVAVAAVAYLGYNHFNSSEQISEGLPEVGDKQKGEGLKKISPDLGKGTPGSKQSYTTPTPHAVQKQEEISEDTDGQKDITKEVTRYKTYKDPTYNYQLTFPREWPLKVRNKEEVSFGYTYPQNGMGAVKVEVGENLVLEFEKELQSARARSGIKVEERRFTLDRFPATKYILSNTMNGDRDFYILADNSSFDYIIKYSNESPAFVGRAEQVVGSFEFIK